MKINVLVHR